MAGNENSTNSELVMLANAIRENRRRRLNMQTALHHLVARRRQVLNVSFLLLLLISSQRDNIASVPRCCRRLDRNTQVGGTRYGTHTPTKDLRKRCKYRDQHLILS